LKSEVKGENAGRPTSRAIPVGTQAHLRAVRKGSLLPLQDWLASKFELSAVWRNRVYERDPIQLIVNAYQT